MPLILHVSFGKPASQNDANMALAQHVGPPSAPARNPARIASTGAETAIDNIIGGR